MLHSIKKFRDINVMKNVDSAILSEKISTAKSKCLFIYLFFFK